MGVVRLDVVELVLIPGVVGFGERYLDPDPLDPPCACLETAARPIPCLLLPDCAAFRRGGRFGGGADRLAYACSADAATSSRGIWGL
jgi:hypothetical protein